MRELLGQGRSREVIALSSRVLEHGVDPEEKAVTSTQRLAAYFNVGLADSADCRESEDQAGSWPGPWARRPRWATSTPWRPASAMPAAPPTRRWPTCWTASGT
ncbi:hypothetical protein ACFQ9X_28330 [Catenulispora yoronensis]